MHPATLYGHIIAATEIVCGLAFTAILTGLTLVRFSRAQAKFVFAPHPVVAVHNGKPTLMLRIGNGRMGALMDAAAKLNVLLSVTNAEGKRFRRAREPRLERAHIPVFPLSWTLNVPESRTSGITRKRISMRQGQQLPRCAQPFSRVAATPSSLTGTLQDRWRLRPNEEVFRDAGR